MTTPWYIQSHNDHHAKRTTLRNTSIPTPWLPKTSSELKPETNLTVMEKSGPPKTSQGKPSRPRAQSRMDLSIVSKDCGDISDHGRVTDPPPIAERTSSVNLVNTKSSSLRVSQQPCDDISMKWKHASFCMTQKAGPTRSEKKMAVVVPNEYAHVRRKDMYRCVCVRHQCSGETNTTGISTR